jgi:clan AA aspartic protease
VGGTVVETAEMGRVLTEVTITNLGDAFEASRGKLPADQVRSVTVTQALVDTGATSLGLPPSLIQQLGLKKRYEKRAITAGGERTIGVYEAVRVEIMGRDATVDPLEVPEGNPVLVGQIPLEMMDWVVDPRSRRLVGNPAHGGEHVLELL